MLYRSTLLCHFNFHMESRRHHIVFNICFNFFLIVKLLIILGIFIFLCPSCTAIILAKVMIFLQMQSHLLDGFKPLSIA